MVVPFFQSLFLLDPIQPHQAAQEQAAENNANQENGNEQQQPVEAAEVNPPAEQNVQEQDTELLQDNNVMGANDEGLRQRVVAENRNEHEE